tara:strand:- start:102 stop:1301 length:1200 start_codon:yes stop_codon:yes gene_type:complete
MTHAKSMAALALVALLGYYKLVKKGRNDLEGRFWSLVPPRLAHHLRTSYFTARCIQYLFNTTARVAAAVALLFTKPQLLYKHLYPPHLIASDVPYAKTTRTTHRTQHQRLDVYAPNFHTSQMSLPSTPSTPVVVFIHGGIWTLFNRHFFRLLGEQFAQLGVICVIPSYSYYPDGNTQNQIEDVALAINWVEQHISIYGGSKQKIVLCGQSSGAHVTSQYILRSAAVALESKVCGYIGCSGVFDPLHHNTSFESKRGVNHISPLVPANGGLLRWHNVAGCGKETDETQEEPMARYSSCLKVMQLSKQSLQCLPPMLLLHGKDDTTVPTSSSEFFLNQCKKAMGNNKETLNIEMKLLDGIDHATYLYDISVNEGPMKNAMMNNIMCFVSGCCKIANASDQQ